MEEALKVFNKSNSVIRSAFLKPTLTSAWWVAYREARNEARGHTRRLSNSCWNEVNRVHWFPRAAIAGYHRRGALEQHNIQETGSLRSRCHQAPLKALEENLFHTFLLASRLAGNLHIPWLADTFFHSLSPSSHHILLVCLHVVFLTCTCLYISPPLLIRTAALLESGWPKSPPLS